MKYKLLVNLNSIEYKTYKEYLKFMNLSKENIKNSYDNYFGYRWNNA